MRRVPAPLLALGAGLLFLLPLWLRVSDGHPFAPIGFTTSGSSPFFVLLAVFLGILSILLLDQLLAATLRRADERLAILALFLCNPVTLSLFTSLSIYTVAVPLALLALLRRGAFRLLFLAATTLIAPVFGLLLALIHSQFNPEGRWRLLAAGTLPFLVTLPLGLVERLRLAPWATAFAEFGAPLGLSILFLFLSLLELLLRWNERRARGYAAAFLLLLALLPFSLSARVLLGLFSSLFAGLFAARLLRRRWALKDARAITLLLVGCNLLFLLVAQIVGIGGQEPRAALVTVLSSAEEGLILAPESLGAVVERLGYRAAIHACVVERERCADAERLYRSWRLNEALPLLDHHQIRYLLLTDEMRQGLVWSRDEEGLLFLLKHSEKFRLIAEEEGYELWEYLA